MIQRNQLADNLKAIGILAVVLGHINSPYSNLIYSFHMPLFFFVGGFFIPKNLELLSFITRNFKKLIGAYFIFTLLGIGVEILKRLALHREALEIAPTLKGLFLTADLNGTYALVLWFLPCLFVSKVLLASFLKFTSNMYILIFLSLLAFSISSYFPNYFQIPRALTSLIYLVLGYFYYQMSITRERERERVKYFQQALC
ncbi:acyltransferase family protein [Helicobacter cetorum]|uniref:acyltransferase family protein n=1 Tax=Helicobacter cetorum TaxID=138563 RepID=UPI000CF13E4C|nr:acyltransferase family protein [Helicobacter cetorum]